ncbi:DUF2723 domain-containing protein [Candidatus Palauibacter sp.]|uniref:glycosyltransferase family 117 protein n=1 Tax=Candidatus Palauibacter sp. TaxID=3101350 RepID=UPI003AF2B188
MNGIEREKIGPLTLRLWGLLTALAVWALYLLTIAPTTGFWDTSEYVTTAHILGLPHPPGNPFFVLIGRVWDILLGFTGLPVALRINVLSATLSAGASFFWFLAVARMVAHFRENRHEVLVTAIVAVWIGATAFTVWTQSNLNEKVYTLSLFVVAVVSYLAMVWMDEADTARGNRLLLLIALLLGLGWANHTMSLLPGLALTAFVLFHRWRAAFNPLVLGLGVTLLAVGYSVQLLFVPIRSAQNPIIDEADPECPTVVSAITPKRVDDRFGRSKWAVVCEPLALSLIRDQYGPGPVTQRQAPLSAQYANYWQYFDWQWARALPPGARLVASMLFLFLALVGLWTHLKSDRKTFVYSGTLLFTVTLMLVYYLNFKYGYSLYLEEVPNYLEHEVRERDYFYIIGFQLWGIYAGLGLAALWGQWTVPVRTSQARDYPTSFSDDRPTGFSARHRKAAPLLAIGLIPLFFNYSRADRTGDRAARDWAYNILQSVEPYAVLFTNGDNDTFPLWYLQEVEGIRRDVTVIVHSYLGTGWYPKQLRELTAPCEAGASAADSPTTVVCQRPFDVAAAASPYAAMSSTPPTRSIMAWNDAQIDGLPPGFAVAADTTFQISRWIGANALAGESFSYPDIMVYHIIQQSLGDRPVYFAATAPPVYGKWRLQPHLVRHGLAFKLVNGPLEASEDLVDLREYMPNTALPTWNDRVRTRELLWDVFLVEDLLDWEEWPEPSTESSIPAQYYLGYYLHGMTEEHLGDVEAAEQAYQRADHFGLLAGLRPPPESPSE